MSSNHSTYVLQYFSDEDDYDLYDKENEKFTRKSRGRAKVYVKFATFENQETAKEALKGEHKSWKFKAKYDTIGSPLNHMSKISRRYGA